MEQQHLNKFPGPQEIERPCLFLPANIPQVRDRRARRWHETPRRAHGRTPVGGRLARPSRKAVEKASTRAGGRRRPESQTKLKIKSELQGSLTAAEIIFFNIYKVPLRDVGGMNSGVSQVEKGDACKTLAHIV